MQQPLIPHRIVIALVVMAIFLPITICVVIGVAALLKGMGDIAGGVALLRLPWGAAFFGRST